MSKVPDLTRVPHELTESLMRKIMFAIPPGAGMACSEGASWDAMKGPLVHLVEAVLGAQKELFDAEKEARRDASSAAGGG